MNNCAGSKEDENLLEKSNNNEMKDKDEKVLEELSGDELSNLGVDDDVTYEKLKEFSETLSQMVEKIKDFLVSEEENEQEDNAGDVLTKKVTVKLIKWKKIMNSRIKEKLLEEKHFMEDKKEKNK